MFAADDEEGVRALMRDMDAHKVRVDTRFFAGLISQNGNQPQWVREEMEKRNVARDAKMFEAQVRIAGVDDKTLMLQLFNEMRANGFLPTPVCLF